MNPHAHVRIRLSGGFSSLRSVAAVVLFSLAGLRAASADVLVNDSSDALHSPGCATTGTGDCTLRDAITFANAGSGATINFDITGGCTGVCTISLTTSLPEITKSVVINGYSQPGSSPNTLAVGDNAVLLIEISGGAGLRLSGAGANTIEGLVIGGGVFGVSFLSGDGNTVTGNFIGTDPTGQTAHGEAGVFILSSNNTIGGTAPAARNLISGTSGAGGIQLLGAAANNVILGNYIGTNAGGTAALGNGIGVSTGGTNTTIGGTAAGAGNLISGNQSDGIASTGSGTVIEGNLIGTDATGTLPLGNGIGVVAASTANRIGGTTANAGNVIAANVLYGIVLSGSGTVVEGNFIGTNASDGSGLGNGKFGAFTAILVTASSGNAVGGTAAGAGNVIAHNFGNGVVVQGATSTGNTIRGNSIFDNVAQAGSSGLGIHFGSGIPVTANDACDADTGANGLQNFPVITAATIGGGNLSVSGTLDSTAGTEFQIDLYLTGCDPSGYGEGENYLGSTTATTDGSCHGTFSTSLPIVGSGSVVTATATDPSGNTSEFSADFQVGQGLALQYYTVPPCRVVDTRNATGSLGGPALFGGQTRVFALTGHCGIPLDALSVALNVTVTGSTAAGDLRLFPGGSALPLVSTINYRLGQTRANNGVAALSCLGTLGVHCDQSPVTYVHLIIDVLGYFK